MPVSAVIIGGIGIWGLTSVWKVPVTSPPRTFTTPTSVIRSVAGEPPVVSRSRTANSTSIRGLRRSSRDCWTARTLADPRPGRLAPTGPFLPFAG
jgi:hypothetical protein